MEVKRVTVFLKEDFRTWLQKYHQKEKKVELVLHKRHTKKNAPTHRELMEEAICFGWIDTIVKRRDEDTYIRTFTRRTDKSNWSDNTLSYAKQLVKEKRMTPFGLAFYEEGKKKPTLDHGIPKNPSMPLALKKALAKEPLAQKKFEAFPPSIKRMLFRWMLRAKRPETLEKRINVTVERAKEGETAFSSTQ